MYDKNDESDDELIQEYNEKESHEKLLEIIVELETTLMAINYIEGVEGVDGELTEEDISRYEEWEKKRREKFNPDNYKINTENEDNFDPPKPDEVRAMYKGVGKPAVVWKLKKNGEDIKDVIGGDYEKIHYRDQIYIIADKEREEKDLDPNVVLDNQILRGKFLIIKDVSGKMVNLTASTIVDLKREMFDFRVRYVDENYMEIPKEEFDER